jgi:hypothetical protein
MSSSISSSSFVVRNQENRIEETAPHNFVQLLHISQLGSHSLKKTKTNFYWLNFKIPRKLMLGQCRKNMLCTFVAFDDHSLEKTHECIRQNEQFSIHSPSDVAQTAHSVMVQKMCVCVHGISLGFFRSCEQQQKGEIGKILGNAKNNETCSNNHTR